MPKQEKVARSTPIVDKYQARVSVFCKSLLEGIYAQPDITLEEAAVMVRWAVLSLMHMDMDSNSYHVMGIREMYAKNLDKAANKVMEDHKDKFFEDMFTFPEKSPDVGVEPTAN